MECASALLPLTVPQPRRGLIDSAADLDVELPLIFRLLAQRGFFQVVWRRTASRVHAADNGRIMLLIASLFALLIADDMNVTSIQLTCMHILDAADTVVVDTANSANKVGICQVLTW